MSLPNTAVDPNLAKTFLVKWSSPLHAKQWIENFLGLDFPDSWVDPDSNSSPIHWMYNTYKMYEENVANKSPDTIVISSRESYKTLSEAVFAIVMMSHFGATIAHMAAIVPQASAAQKYIDAFITKVKPYLEYHGIQLDSNNSKEISMKLDPGTLNERTAYMKIIVCTVTGANCISPETILWLKDGKKVPAKNIVAGDEILTFDYIEQKDVAVRVGHVTHTHKLCRMVKFSDGSNLIASKDHRIFTDSGWCTVGNLRLGMKVTSGEEPINTNVEAEAAVERDAMQMLYGSLLGDSSLSLMPSGKSSRFRVSHTWEHREYLILKARMLKSIGIDTNLYESHPKLSSQVQVICTSKSYSLLHELRNKLYTPNKRVTKEWLNNLTWEGVAYWFMDDARGNAQKIGSAKDHCYQLSTCGFSLDENILIADWFKSKGLECSVSSVTNQSKKRYDLITFTLEASRKLSSLIEPWFVPCMAYKLVTSENLLLSESIDSDIMIKNDHRGFVATTEDFKSFLSKTRRGRQWRSSLKSKLQCKIVEIVDVGMQKVLDVHVDTDRHNLRSFYANSKKLVHNSSHTNIFTIDEIDTIRSKEQIRAYNEAQFIPGLFNGQHPVTIKTSTLKFPGGLFSKEMEKALKKNYRVYRWNIIDITEKCEPERHQPDLPKQTVYVGKNLPLKTLTQTEFDQLNSKEHEQYDQIEAMGGCAKCPLLPVCRGRLASRSEKDKGGLWKNIDFTMAQFDKTDPDLAEAQLMCWKPSSQGMVYPRFLDKADGSANTYTLNQAYEVFTGEQAPKDLTIEDFVTLLQKQGIKFYAGVDWGFRHAYAITVSCLLPSGQWWLIDAYSISGLEFEQMIDLALNVRDMYRPVKWFADTSQPMFIKAFKKRKMPCAEFKKDVMGGIEATRGQIINAKGLRRLKVIKHDRTEIITKMFAEHCFLLDSLGNLTKEPDDGEFADVADTIRYQAQNLFKAKSQMVTSTIPQTSNLKGQAPERTYEDWMTQKIRSIQGGNDTESKGKTPDGNVIWDFGSDDE